MTPRLKKLLIACHPDRHGGDHSHMEAFHAAAKRPSVAGIKPGDQRCEVCGVAISAHARFCGIHGNPKRRPKPALAAALSLLLGILGCRTAPVAPRPAPIAPASAARIVSAAVAPPAPVRTVTFSWHPDGAVISDVETSTNLFNWSHLSRVTNTNAIVVTMDGPQKFFRVSHPQFTGHHWDTGAWRVNRELLQIEP